MQIFYKAHCKAMLVQRFALPQVGVLENVCPTANAD
jgi:hypothetical protein